MKKANITLSNFLIALVLIGGFAGAIGLFLNNGAKNYNVNYNNETKVFNKLEELSDDIGDYKINISNADSPIAQFQDLIGGLFNSGYKTLIMIGGSFDIFDTLLTEGLKKLNLGEGYNLLKVTIATIILIIIFITIILSVLLKSDRL